MRFAISFHHFGRAVDAVTKNNNNASKVDTNPFGGNESVPQAATRVGALPPPPPPAPPSVSAQQVVMVEALFDHQVPIVLIVLINFNLKFIIFRRKKRMS